jgi:hypothetical protein
MSKLRKIQENEFWVSNISDMNVCVADLALTIPSRKHVNLLNSRHYSYTIEQLEASAKSGSLYKKRDKLKVRQVVPEVSVKPGVYISKAPLFLAQQKLRSGLVIDDPKYEELEVSEESFAEEFTKDE